MFTQTAVKHMLLEQMYTNPIILAYWLVILTISERCYFYVYSILNIYYFSCTDKQKSTCSTTVSYSIQIVFTIYILITKGYNTSHFEQKTLISVLVSHQNIFDIKLHEIFHINIKIQKLNIHARNNKEHVNKNQNIYFLLFCCT